MTLNGRSRSAFWSAILRCSMMMVVSLFWTVPSVGFGATAARHNPIPHEKHLDRLYVFGDSYSDIGAGYVDGNGPTALFYFATRLGRTLRPPCARVSPADSLDFAVSGAQSGSSEGNRVKSNMLGRGLLTQVDDLRKALSDGTVRLGARNLAFIAIGLNDAQLPTSETKANIELAVDRLHDNGLRQFRIALLPEATPAFAAVSQRINPAIRSAVSETRARYPDSDIRLSNWGHFFDTVKLHGARYNMINVNDPCAPGRSLFGQEEKACDHPDQYYFYHPEHPSTAVHRIVGEMLWREWMDK